jgi:hypothetical protein
VEQLGDRLAETGKDGTWAKKGSKSYFAYKLLTKLDTYWLSRVGGERKDGLYRLLL